MTNSRKKNFTKPCIKTYQWGKTVHKKGANNKIEKSVTDQHINKINE